MRAHLRTLDPRQWSARSHCRGWSVKDVVAHLSTDEVYNQACLDGTLEVLQEWEARQALVRRAWGQIGLDGRIQTSIGRYPLRLQIWHLAREYAIHADDVEVPMSQRERQVQLRWRAAFGLFASQEEGEAVDAELAGDRVRLRHEGRVYDLDLESFIAYLTNRPQQLKDSKQRALVRRLGATG